MTRRRDLERHRRSLDEIRGILNSMRTLAYLETRKLTRFLETQHRVVESIEAAAADLIGFHPDLLPSLGEQRPVYLVIGSEHGFCGDFNHRLLQSLEAPRNAAGSGERPLIAVGHKLHALMAGDDGETRLIGGAGMVEEVTPLLNTLIELLTDLSQRPLVDSVYCLYHKGGEGIELRRLLPPFDSLLPPPNRFSHPPLLQRSPAELLLSLTEHYLFAALHEVFFYSLLAENQHRVNHTEGAVRHLDETSTKLAHRCNALRQEEIIEEIEVILLSATTPEESAAGRSRQLRRD